MRRWRVTGVIMMFLAILVVIPLGCGKESESEIVTIKIGNLTDLTGPASTAVVPVLYAMQDLFKLVNEQEPIPGVKLEIVSYDVRYDPSLDIPGYEFVKNQGVKLVYTPLPTTTTSLQGFLADDKIVLATGSPTPELLTPPGWTFAHAMVQHHEVKALLNWVSENDWDYSNGIPKIGSAGWDEPFHVAMKGIIKEYCDENPDKFEYVAGYTTPMGTLTWTAEADGLKNCDYVYPPSTGLSTTTFIETFRDKGYTAKFLGCAAQSGFWGLHVDGAGAEALEGMLMAIGSGWWNDTYPEVVLAKQTLEQNHPAEAENVMYSAGNAYLISWLSFRLMTDIIREAVKDVGAKNFDSQAYFDAATHFSTTYQGFHEMGFTPTRRYSWSHTAVYESIDGVPTRLSGWIENMP